MLEPLPADSSYEEMCELVGVFGAIESIRIVAEKQQALPPALDTTHAKTSQLPRRLPTVATEAVLLSS